MNDARRQLLFAQYALRGVFQPWRLPKYIVKHNNLIFLEKIFTDDIKYLLVQRTFQGRLGVLIILTTRIYLVFSVSNNKYFHTEHTYFLYNNSDNMPL